MQFGLFLPPFGELADPQVLAAVAARAEVGGWDGVFLWDHVNYRAPVEEIADPWIALAAMATATERVRLGALVTPLARRRPQVLARQTATLDVLARGRLVVGVGLGLDQSGRELSAFGEELDDRVRARMLDEALEVITALWSGENVKHEGEHYRADSVRFWPRPIQRPRIPVWVAARAPNQRPLDRAARWDGLFLIDHQEPDDLRAAVARLQADGPLPDDYAIAVNGPPGTDPQPWADAGATWWLTALDPSTTTAGSVLALADRAPGGER